MQKISQAFFNLYHQNESETDNLFETIKSCLNGIAEFPGEFNNSIPTIDHFKDDTVINYIVDLFSAANEDTDLVAKVLYIKWYYRITFLAMGSIASKKVVEYIHKTTDVKVNVKVMRSDFRYILGNPIKFSIRNAAGGGPFDVKYSGFGLYGPTWNDILEICEHNKDGKEFLMSLKMPGVFEVFTETGASSYWEDSVRTTDLGWHVKEYFIDKIKEIIANR